MKVSDNTTPHLSSEYDGEVIKTIPYYEKFHSEAIDLIRSIKPEIRVWLDTGCGTGYLAEKLIRLLPEIRCILCDISSSMVEQALKRLAGSAQDRVRFIVSSSQDLSKNVEEKADVVTAIQVHQYLSRQERKEATRQIFQILNPGGVYVTFENIYPVFEEGVQIGLRRWMNFQLKEGRDLRTVLDHADRFNKAYFPIPVQEHLNLLKETGFKVYDLFWYSHMQAGFYAIKE